MSTKTTFKRVALVAVAALGFGLLSVVPSNSAALQKITLGSVSGVQVTTATIGLPVTTLVNVNGYCDAAGSFANTNYMTVFTALPTTSRAAAPALRALAWNNDTYSQASSWYAPSSSGVSNGQVLNDGAYTNVGGGNWMNLACGATGRYNVYGTLTFTPDVAGTYSLLIQDPTQSYTQTTWTVVVAAKGAITAADSTLVAAPTTLIAAKAAGTSAGTIAVGANNADGNADSSTISATISGSGLISLAGSYVTAGRAVSASGNIQTISVYADGTDGTGTISIYSGSTLLGTKTVTFYGATASLTASVKKPVNGSTTGVIEVIAKDAAGNIVPSVPLTITSGTTATVASFAATSSSASQAAAGTASVNVTGVAATHGVVVLTIKDATGLVSTTASVTVSELEAATVTVAFDKSEYLPGEKATLTITAKDANGLMVPNALANASGAEYSWSQNLSTASTLGADSAFSNGAQTMTVYMPASYGTFTVVGTLVDGAAWSSGLDDTTVTASATVLNPAADQAQAATDAAAEATDAANAATDAANAAAEAADAATAAAQDAADAVAALSAQVADLIAGLKAQLTALTNLVIKIQKKVKA